LTTFAGPPSPSTKARAFVDGLGGPANVVKVESAAETRLRVVVRDLAAVDHAALRAAGVAGTVNVGENALHLIVGMNADQYAAEIHGQLAGALTRA
jgi:PTS system glucose-specific IIC component